MALEFYRGDTKKLNLTFKKKDGSPWDITGATIWFTIKKDPNDDDDKALLQVSVSTHTDPTNGKTVLTLSKDDTNIEPGFSYPSDFQMVDDDGNVTTLATPEVNVLPDITRRST